MTMPRETWTDERLDDLNGRVERGFDGMQREFIAVRSEMRAEFKVARDEMRTEFAAVRAEIRDVRSEMRDVRSEVLTTQRLLIQLFIPLTVTLALGFAGLILTRV